MKEGYEVYKTLYNLKKFLNKKCNEDALIVLNGSWEKWELEKKILLEDVSDEVKIKNIFRRFLYGDDK